MPVGDRLFGLLVRRNGFELRERDRERSLAPGDRDEHLALALTLGRHPDDLDLLAHRERRDLAFLDAPGEKWDVQFLFEVATPSHRALVLVVGVDDDVKGDPLLAVLVLFGLLALRPDREFWPCLARSTLRRP